MSRGQRVDAGYLADAERASALRQWRMRWSRTPGSTLAGVSVWAPYDEGIKVVGGHAKAP